MRDGVPRFVSSQNYASGFGLEWTRHARTQYDSESGLPLSATRFFGETSWPRRLPGELVLEAGSGSGRFTEQAASTGAFVASFDYSDAVDANYQSNGLRDNVLIVQADIFAMPFRPAGFDKVFCFGMLQHTPDPRRAFQALPEMLKPGGELVADIYKATLVKTLLATKYYVRPFTRRIPAERLYRWVQRYVDFMWPLCRVIRRVPRIGYAINWRLLVADYSFLGLDERRLKEWAYLDTFDMLAPRYDYPQRLSTFRRWFEESGLIDLSLAYTAHGIVGRGRVPEARGSKGVGSALASAATPQPRDDARRFVRRARRRGRRLVHSLGGRLRDRAGAGMTAEDFSRCTGLRRNQPRGSSALVVMPGPRHLPAVGVEQRVAVARQAAAAREHRFDVLGSGPVLVARVDDEERRTRVRASASDLPAEIVERFVPVDWHSDFRSGYRWDPQTYYLDVPLAPRLGTDIKVPRELSRFQHVGALGLEHGVANAAEFVLQTLDWIEANPVRRGVNWASTMDVAIRLVNWIWGLRLFDTLVAQWPSTIWHIHCSLYDHGLHVAANLEYYEECTTNHYLANVAGLLYLGAAFPEFPESDAWLMFGLQELVSEMDRQVYPDGADFEASTHYHRLVAETFLSCAALAERLTPERRRRLSALDLRAGRHLRLKPPARAGLDLEPGQRVLPQTFYQRLAAMADFTSALTKPNGLVPQFGDNDSARLHKLCPILNDDPRDHRHVMAVAGALFGAPALRARGATCALESDLIVGDLPPVDEVTVTAAEAACRHFPDAGVAVVRRGAAYLAVTCGPNGQHGRGGHGHNDKLSFELNIRGCDIIVDGGCPVYTGDPALRNRFRSTEAHNTLFVHGKEQDAWNDGPDGLFRLPERSRPRLTAVDGWRVSGVHEGFGAPHWRSFTLGAQELVIEDEHECRQPAGLSFNLDPQVRCCAVHHEDGRAWADLVHESGFVIALRLEGVADLSVAEGFFSTGYGRRVPNERLVARLAGPRAVTRLVWSL